MNNQAYQAMVQLIPKIASNLWIISRSDTNATETNNMAKATARHILVDTEEQCNALKDEIAGGAEFADLAKQHSSCPSGQQGGDLGEFGPGMMVKEFDEVVFSADVNTVQGPVKTQFGYHLLEVTQRTD
jgi:peptidyl-prolyl cis-trans isomerase C